MSLITGPGRYLTRGGEEVCVFQNGDNNYPWAYRLRSGQISVDDDGYQMGSKYPSHTDIVAKAPEAAPSKEEAPKLDDGGPAFPIVAAGESGQGYIEACGLSLRDYVAAKVLQAIIPISKGATRTEDAEEAYRYADAFLAARRRIA